MITFIFFPKKIEENHLSIKNTIDIVNITICLLRFLCEKYYFEKTTKSLK